MEGLEYQTLYTLWTYTATRISVPKQIKYVGKRGHYKVFKTYGDILNTVIDSISNVKILDLRILLRLRELAECEWTKPGTCNVKNYASWKANGGDYYWVLNIGHRWLRRFMEQPARMLRAMRFDPKEFVWHESTRSGDEIVVDGKIFRAPDVHVFECLSTMPWDYVGRWHDESTDAPF